MKYPILMSIIALMLTFSCTKKGVDDSTLTVSGGRAVIPWQDCAVFTDHDMTICFVDAKEYRCPCDVNCIWEGAVDATLRVTTTTGIDTTITLTTNSDPATLPSTATIDGKLIRFVNTDAVTCSDYESYEKYKVIIEVE